MGKYTYDTLGLMIDMSRNAVMSVAQVKEYLGYLKKMGYNCAMLYTEDTYEVQDEPYFGYMRGGYSAEDLRELDSYAASLGIEFLLQKPLVGLLVLRRKRCYRLINLLPICGIFLLSRSIERLIRKIGKFLVYLGG